MKHGIICPVAYLEKFATKSNFHLVLPHLFEKFPKYKEFYKERAREGDFIICDNSLFELGKCMDYKIVLEKAEEINASVVVGPEVFGSYAQNLRLIYEFLEWKDKIGSKMKVLGIAQGKNSDEIFESFLHLNSIDGIDYLGLPFMLDYEEENTFGIKSLTLRRVLNRWHLTFLIASVSISESIDIKPTHLFGLSDALELQKYKNPDLYSWIFSNDSSSAFVHGYNLIRYADRGLPREKIEQKVDFGLNEELTSQQETFIEYNIDKILSWL